MLFVLLKAVTFQKLSSKVSYFNSGYSTDLAVIGTISLRESTSREDVQLPTVLTLHYFLHLGLLILKPVRWTQDLEFFINSWS